METDNVSAVSKKNGRLGAGIVQLRKDKITLNDYSYRSLGGLFGVSHDLVMKAVQDRSDSDDAVEIRRFVDNVLVLPVEGDYYEAC